MTRNDFEIEVKFASDKRNSIFLFLVHLQREGDAERKSRWIRREVWR